MHKNYTHHNTCHIKSLGYLICLVTLKPSSSMHLNTITTKPRNIFTFEDIERLKLYMHFLMVVTVCLCYSFTNLDLAYYKLPSLQESNSQKK